MKRTSIASILATLLWSGSAWADTVYISSMQAQLLSEPSGDAAVVTVLSRGTAAETMGSDNGWVQINAGGATGWVRQFFVSDTPPGDRVSLLGSAQENSMVHARRRVSSEVTAASSRGLMDDDKMARGRNADDSAFDPAALEKMETVALSEKELITFLKEGGLMK